MPNSVSGKFPLSSAERSRLYRQRFSASSESLNIRVTDERINGLAKRGYLGPDEVDDRQAISQALSLFLWGVLFGAPRQIARKGAKRLGGRKSLRSRKSMSFSRGATTT